MPDPDPSIYEIFVPEPDPSIYEIFVPDPDPSIYENFWPDPNNYSDLDLDSTTFYLVQKIVIKELQKS